MSSAPHAVELTGLTRTYRAGRDTVTALDDVDLVVPEGQTLGVLGRNGAGKTTLTKILSTLLHPTRGRAAVLGHDVVRDERAVRENVTAVFGGDRGLYPMLSGRENLRYFGAVHGVPHRELRHRIPELLEDAGLAEAAARRVETYSKGMRQRLQLCVGLLTRPRLLLLDEPTVGLDPTESARLRDIVARFPSEGTTVLLTSHNLTDVERLADRVVMLRDGRLTHDLGLAAFRRLAGYEAVLTVRLPPGSPPPRGLEQLGAVLADGTAPTEGAGLGGRTAGTGVENGTTADRTVSVAIERWSADLLARLAQAMDGQQILDLAVRPATLDEAFARAAEAGGPR